MMSSRDSILSVLAKNKPAQAPLPKIDAAAAVATDIVEKFTEVAVSIGSRVFSVGGYAEIQEILGRLYPEAKQVISVVEEVSPSWNKQKISETPPHALADVDLAILRGKMAVAENSAIWIEEDQLGQRVLPFICQHLVLLISRKSIVPSMHQAYPLIGSAAYGYGVFIAGPSKTADIEQSLVLGAHGPRSLTVFILADN